MEHLCAVKETRYEFSKRIFKIKLICGGDMELVISLPYEEAGKLKSGLNDMEMKMYIYKTGGFVDG